MIDIIVTACGGVDHRRCFMNSGPVIDLTAVAPRPPVVGWLIIDWLGN